MALGVLNNLSAIYAENNLNNTNASLQTVLEQLSSGSRINSGADDAAGLSLVNGLAANSAALTQSATNATEGVGLLQVADGALSQVTNLLNRAITLATEASNGTLNSTQSSAANQEYQSILSEINNIGSTTTYNQEQVFSGKSIAIYTGDSSTSGSSIDNISIRTLSSANVGDTSGVISYSNGANNVFIDLSKGGENAAATDSLNSSGTTTVTVNYVTSGAGGAPTVATANITVGSGTTYANTAQGMIDAINNAGLGLTATFSTAAEAGSAAESAAEAANANGGGGSDTGIEITGSGVGTGTNGAGEIGTLTVNNNTDTLGGTLTIVGSDGQSHAIALGTANSTDTLANLASTINGDGLGVRASYNSTTKAIVFTAVSSAVTVSGGNLTDTPVNPAPVLAAVSNAAPALASIGGALTVANANDILGGTLTVTDTTGGLHTVTLGIAGSTDTLANLQNYLNVVHTSWGITAASILGGKGLSFSGTLADNIVGANLTDTTPGIDGTLTVANSADTLGGTMTVTDTGGTQHTFNLGVAGQTDTLADLKTYLNTTNVGWGITAAVNGAGTSMTFGGTLLANVVGANLTDSSAAANISLTGTPVSSSQVYYGQVGALSLSGATSMASDKLSGSLTIGSNTVVLGTSTGANKTDTLANLAATINAGDYGVKATYSATNKSIVFTSANTDIGIYGANLGDATTSGAVTSTSVATIAGQPANNTNIVVGAAGDLLSGTLKGTDGSGRSFQIALGVAAETDTVANLANYVNNDTDLGITATLSNSNKTVTFTDSGGQTMYAVNLAQNTATLSETNNAPYPAQLGTLSISGASSSAGDTLNTTALTAGTLTIGAATFTVDAANGNNTMLSLAQYIDAQNDGILATLDSTGKVMTFTSTEAATAGAKVSSSGLVDTTDYADGMVTTTSDTPTTDYSPYYSVGITGVIADSTTGGGTANAGMVVDADGASGIASTSYSDAAGEDLSGTNLSSQENASTALQDLNVAIADAAALDGYIGGQINTLNSVNEVMSTQQENLLSAQNAIQATDYASATSNMSKYEILSQTGIAALAQANSVEQEVTKLLQ